jgi:hypothetical protein
MNRIMEWFTRMIYAHRKTFAFGWNIMFPNMWMFINISRSYGVGKKPWFETY